MGQNVVMRAVERLTDQEKRVLLEEYRVMEQTGSTGDGVLRATAEQAMGNSGTAGPAALWLDMVGNATYRYFAEKYLRELESTDGRR